jgi:DNA-binding NarL/FixJ family response regulator
MARSYRIVLADDHVLIRQGLRSLLDGVADLDITGEAADGLELLELLNKAVPNMVILDVSMPKLRGIEAVPEIKMKHPHTKVLMLSMHKEYLSQALAAGADGYLLKEDAERDIFSAIETVRQGRIYISPRLTDTLLTDRVLSSGPLTARERNVLRLIAGGKSNKEIAEVLVISVRTVESHRASIMGKLNLKNTADLIRYAIEKGYV